MSSTSPDKDLLQERLFLALLAVAAGLRFINLGFLDMQAWDEAVYAVRSMGILRFGGWLDQTAFSVDGLYSSFHPPLHVWLTTVAYSLLGVSEFSTRFVSACLGGATLFVLYAIGKRLMNREVGLLAALLYGLTPFVSFYARQGQFDTSMTFFISLAFLFLIRGIDGGGVRQYTFAALAVGAALMTRSFVGGGVLIALAAFILLSRGRSPISLKRLLIVMLLAGLLPLPWYAMMIVKHGGGNPLFVLQAADLYERAVIGFEENIKPLGVLYYFNQLIVLIPLIVVWGWFGLWRAIRENHAGWKLVALWFLVYFVVFSIVRSKLAVYVFPVLPAFSLLAARTIWHAVEGGISRTSTAFLMGGTLLATLWASSQEWRNGVKALLRDLFQFHLPPPSQVAEVLPLILLVTACVFVTLAFFHAERPNSILKALPVGLVIASLTWTLTHVLYLDSFQHRDGGKALATFVQQHGIDQLLVAGYERNPQISYYFEGVDLGWREDVHFRRIIPPRDRQRFRSWLLAETTHEPNSTLLVLEKDKFIRYETIDPLAIAPPDYELVFESRRYAAFQRAKGEHYALAQ